MIAKREIVAEEISSEEYRGASEQARKRGPESFWLTKESMEGIIAAVPQQQQQQPIPSSVSDQQFFTFDFEESMAPYQKKFLKLFLDDGFF